MNFRDILEEKLNAAEEPAARPERGTGTADPAHLAYLLGTIPVRRFHTPPKSAAPKAAVRPAVKPPFQKPAPRARRPDHVLTERQKTAMAWFAFQSESLPGDFTTDELKKAFRSLARKTHPDAGGSASLFLELKGHHAALRSVPQGAAPATAAA